MNCTRQGRKRMNGIPKATLRATLFLMGMIVATAQAVVTVSPSEIAQETNWVQTSLLTAANIPPFSFSYNGQSSATLLPLWTRVETDTVLDTNRTQHVITWSTNGLSVRCVAVAYSDYPVVEWTVYLTNTGTAATPMLTNLQALNLTLSNTPTATTNAFTICYWNGDLDASNSFQPYYYTPKVTGTPYGSISFSPPSYSGKSCDTAWPYYNVEEPGGGLILAIGWPGQWASSFTGQAVNKLQILAGQQTTHLVLNAGEQIRSPLIALLFWQGNSSTNVNVVRAQNLWRHWYMAHVIPKVNGGPPPTILQEQGDSLAIVQGVLAAGAPINLLWRDAGAGGETWYPDANGPYTGANQWLNTGTWEVDPSAYPNGFGAMSTQMNALGVQFLLWFEPERVGNTTNSFLGTNNASWLLPVTSYTVGAILNEGNASVFNWLTNHFQGLIKSNGINIYREDMNGNGPLTAWQANDASNRQGITENFYVQGHLAYWDALLAMNPGLRIDVCGSGGRRCDLEEMRRGVPLTRSDYCGLTDPHSAEGEQCQTYGLSSWLPFQGSAVNLYDPYSFRSSYLPSFGFDAGIAAYTAAQVQGYNECALVGPIMLNGDYYPLTGFSQSLSAWMAWQFDRPANMDGIVQVFRQTNNVVATSNIVFQGLSPTNVYDVRNFDTGDLGWYAGSNLMTSGLTVTLPARGSAIFYYTNVQGVALSATATPVAGFTPLTVNFTATGTSPYGAPVTYAWAFGDGGTSTNQNPSYTYAHGGRYLAQVTATDGMGDTNTEQLTISVMTVVGHSMTNSFASYTNTSALTNFPVLVVFGTNVPGFSYSQVASPNGWDLVFLNSDGTPLNYEIDTWNTNGSSSVWVQVPLLRSNAYFQAYWGDTNLASVPAQCSTNGSVWANGYAAVWHLANLGGVLSTNDSTGNGNYGSNYNVTATSGVVGGGAYFNGGAALAINQATNPMLANQQVTMSAWVNPVCCNGTVFMMEGNDNSAFSWGLELGANATLLFTLPNGGTTDWLNDGGITPENQWTYTTGVISGTNKSLYVNGLLKAHDNFSGSLNGGKLPFWIGAQNRAGYNYYITGAMDEVRLSSVARSTNWIWAEYMNMASNALFNSYSAVQPNVHLNLSATGSPLSGIRTAGCAIHSHGDH